MPELALMLGDWLFAMGLSDALATVLANVLVALVPSVLLGSISKMFQKGASGSSLSSQAACGTVTSLQGFEE